MSKSSEAKAPIAAVEYNVRLWKTENGWKVTTTNIDGGSRDVTSKLRPEIGQAAMIAQQFFHEAIALEAEKWRRIGEVIASPDLFTDPDKNDDTFGTGIPDEGLPAEPSEETIEKMNASMLANDRKRGFKG